MRSTATTTKQGSSSIVSRLKTAKASRTGTRRSGVRIWRAKTEVKMVRLSPGGRRVGSVCVAEGERDAGGVSGVGLKYAPWFRASARAVTRTGRADRGRRG